MKLTVSHRLEGIQKTSKGQVNLVMHGTNEFTAELFKSCIKRGMTRLNVNKVVLCDYDKFVIEETGRMPMTDLMEKCTQLIQARLEQMMDDIGSSGRAG